MADLNQTRTGGFSLLKLLFIVAGAAFLVMQGIVLAGWNSEVEASLASKLAPGIAAVVALGYGFFFLGKEGHAEIQGDRLKGRTASGRKYDFALSEIGSIDLNSRLLALKDLQGKVMLLDKTCQNELFAGMVALRLAYREIPEESWAEMKQADGETPPRSIRYFLDNDGNRAFFDAGFMLQIGDETFFMPTHDTHAASRTVRNDQSLSTMADGTKAILKFEPNPRLLPSFEFLPLLTRHSQELAKEYVESHGGCVLKKDAEVWKGEVGGFAVIVEG